MRRPSPAIIIATIALVLAVVPVGSAADGWVKRALFARNAGTVDGFGATRKPHKGSLLVLPATGKLPASILPSNIGGPRRPGGAGRPVGQRRLGLRVRRGRARCGHARRGADERRVALAQGRLLRDRRQGEPSRDARHEHARRQCQLKAGTDGDQVDADLSSSSDDPVALITTHTFAAAGAVTLTCAADDTGVTASDARILALRVGSVAAS